MTKRLLLSLFSILVLSLAAGGAIAVETADLPAEVSAPQAEAVNPETAEALQPELLIDEAPAMSVDRDPAATDSQVLDPSASWGYGICWTSCFPCTSDSDCPFNEQCVFGVQCP